jgi:hypothetical protein
MVTKNFGAAMRTIFRPQSGSLPPTEGTIPRVWIGRGHLRFANPKWLQLHKQLHLVGRMGETVTEFADVGVFGIVSTVVCRLEMDRSTKGRNRSVVSRSWATQI